MLQQVVIYKTFPFKHDPEPVSSADFPALCCHVTLHAASWRRLFALRFVLQYVLHAFVDVKVNTGLHTNVIDWSTTLTLWWFSLRLIGGNSSKFFWKDFCWNSNIVKLMWNDLWAGGLALTLSGQRLNTSSASLTETKPRYSSLCSAGFVYLCFFQ